MRNISRSGGAWAIAMLGWLLCHNVAGADPLELYPPFNDFGLREPALPPPPGQPPIYSTTGPSPGWVISQWRIAGEKLSPFTMRQDGGSLIYDATAPAANVEIVKTSGGVAVTLAQNGASVPCMSITGRPRESDLLLSGAHHAAGITGGTGSGYPLSALNSLQEIATVGVASGPSNPTKGCPVSRTGAVFAILLTDYATHPYQTLFYQLWISHYCRDDIPGAVCQSPPAYPTPGNPKPFSRRNPFGVDDRLTHLGIPMLGNGETRRLDVDVLPRLIIAVETGPPAMDHDPADWLVTGGYFGLASWGDVTVTSTWRGYQLVADTN